MGLFDFFKRGGDDKAAEGNTDKQPVDRKLASLIKTATDKRAQAYDRDVALRGLVELGTAEAAEALLKRFTFIIDPTITDQEEKQLSFDGIVAAGKKEGLGQAVVEHALAHCRGAENLTWGLKVLRELCDPARYETELLTLLARHDTEYTRNVEPKLNLLAALEEVHGESVRVAVERYLEDVNETVRFHAVETTYRQENPVSLEPLVRLLEHEESVRVKNKVCEGALRAGWSLPPALCDRAKKALADVYEYELRPDGTIHKR
jgi:hypothetical protein